MKRINFDDLDNEFMAWDQANPAQPSVDALAAPAAPAQIPAIDPKVADYIKQKFNMGEYSDENRKKLQEDSQIGFGDKAGAALAAIGAGFMGKDAAAAGQAKLNAAKGEKRQKLEDFEKGRSNMLQERDLERKSVMQGREDEAYSRDQDKLKREMDPNSQESQMANELAKSMGYKGPAITAQQFKDFSPVMQKKYEIAEKALDRQERSKDRALQREIALGQKEQARQDKLEKEAKPSEKQVKEFTEFDNALDSIKSIRSQKGSQDTGPLSAAQSNVAQFFGMDDSEKSAFKSEVQDQLAQYIKSISGGAVSDQERANLMQNIPKMSDNDETFNKKLDALEARLERNRQNAITNASKMGKNVKEFERQSNQSAYPKQVRKGNQVATVSNAQEEKEANDEGFQ